MGVFDLKMLNYQHELKQWENRLAEGFLSHKVLKNIDQTDVAANPYDFLQVLLQRSHLSMRAFTPMYDMVSTRIQDERARNTILRLIREEYLSTSASHRQLMVSDLKQLISPAEVIYRSRPSSTTLETIEKLFSLVDYEPEHYDIKALAGLQMAGETLVGLEYERFLAAIRMEGKSCHAFYKEHAEHDSKHSEALEKELKRLIYNDQKFAVARDAMTKAMLIKREFYDQF